MTAVLVNCATVLAGSLLGYFFHKKIHEGFKNTVYIAVGVFTLVIGMSMALESRRIVYLAFSLTAGGLAGSALDIEGKIYAFGEFLKNRFAGHAGVACASPQSLARAPAIGSSEPTQKNRVLCHQAQSVAHVFITTRAAVTTRTA
jgi:hypothetical protein